MTSPFHLQRPPQAVDQACARSPASPYSQDQIAEWLDGRIPVTAHSWRLDRDEPLLPSAERWPVYRTNPDDDIPELRLPTPREALAEAHLLAALPRRVQRQARAGTPMVVVISTPSADWTDAIVDAVDHIYPDASRACAKTAPRRGALPSHPDPIDRPFFAIAEDLEWLSPIVIAAADCTIDIRPSPRAVERAIEVIVGRRARVTEDDYAGLDFTGIAVSIRPGTSARSCVAMMRRLRPKPGALSAGPVDRTPPLDRLVGYGAALAKVRAVAADVERVQVGELAAADLPSILLYGPPGTGKTMLVRSLAKSTGLQLIDTSVSAWFQAGDGMLGGVSKSAKRFFDEALAAAPCIAFLDEIDAIPDRATLDARGRDWWNPVITGMLLLIDKTRAAGTGVVLVAATNHIQHLDAALKRPGRFDRHIEILGPQTPAEIADVLRHHLADDLAGVDLRAAAQLARGGTGAATEGWVRQARETARGAGRPMTLADLTAAIAPPDSRTPAQLRDVALHEAGHAVVGRALGLRVPSVTIVAAENSAGMTQLDGLNGSLTRVQVEARALTMLAGRAVDEIYSGGADAGAAHDLAQATQIVSMVHGVLGLGDQLRSAGVDALASRILAEHRLHQVVEADLQRLMEEARRLVRLHERPIHALADLLVRQRVAVTEDIDRVIAAARPRAPIIAARPVEVVEPDDELNADGPISGRPA